ncbi:hypothetical protein LV89_04790 [Arcicella aurantiaca]|uniref:Probable membrane transporter protein n=1 Tax=Arcicella aurantiaca TaxID=591202 RepID=A0A316DET3_9BACT|nr:sulfite exporter TauE/SafE family protein [Arcicella aurantiaca]PWK16721.1 hypothetical protein LV89_04790 [Arcicella aurantiaca]
MDYQLLLMCFAALLAGFVDSIVGGGGLVQVPALFILYPHFEIPRIIGTNRFSSFMGTAVAGYQYSKKVEIPWKTVIYAGIGAGVMAFLGAKISDIVDEKILKPVILVLMTAIAIYTFTKKNLGQEEKLKHELAKVPFYGLMIGASAGFYNGFVGPGTGSLLVFGFVSVIGFGFLKASAVSKVINVIADVSSLGYFIVAGYVQYEIALPMMICNMAGSYLGSKMAILKGNEFVRTFFLFVIFALILRFAWDIFK